MAIENKTPETAYATHGLAAGAQGAAATGSPNIVVPAEIAAAEVAAMQQRAAADMQANYDEGVKPAADVTVTAIAITTGILTHTSQGVAGYPDDTPCQFFGNKTGAVEIEAGPKVYYLRKITATTSALRLTPGGADITTAAAGSAMVGCGLRFGAALSTQTIPRAVA